MSIEFAPSPFLTLGVEVEIQLVDWKTHDLCPAAPKIFKKLAGESNRIKAEIFQSMIELNTGICPQVGGARADLEAAFSELRTAADSLGVELAVAGTHPFATYDERVIYPVARYRHLLEHRQWFARRLMIFGLHVHVGMRGGDHAIAMMNGVLPYLPYLLALSSSSPFWQSDDTGLASVRTAIFESVPNAGAPILFDDWAGFELFCERMTRSRSIKSLKDLWWDLRPSPHFGTLEIRICDGLPTLSETMACVALAQCLLAWLDEQFQNGRKFTPPPPWLYRENKWRAARWGTHAEFVTSEQGATATFRQLMEQLLVVLEPFAATLGCAKELKFVSSMIGAESSADRQRALHGKSRSLGHVVDALVYELRTDERISML